MANNGVVASITNKDISLRSKKAFIPEPQPEVQSNGEN